MHHRTEKKSHGGIFEYGYISGKTVLLLLAGNLMLIASAKFAVPFWPVPLTLETFAVLLIAATYGPRLATATVTLFLAEGTLGLPVFAGGGRALYLVGPTGGYLAGYLLATILIAYLMDQGRRRSLAHVVGVLLLGDIVIFGLGFAWLATLIGGQDAFSKGVLPFIPGDLLKIALATVSIMIGREVMKKRKSDKR